MSRSQQSLGWSASGLCALGAPGAQVSLQQVFPEAREYTVQFSTTLITGLGAASGPSPLPVAIVTWTVAGNPVRRVINVDNGVSLSGTGEAIRVVIQDSVTPAAAGPFTGRKYPVSVTVAPGTRPAQERVPTLRSIEGQQTIAQLGIAAFAVPRDSGVISVEVSISSAVQATPPYVTVFQLDAVGVQLKTYDLTADDNTRFIPLVPGCQSVSVVNNMTAAVNVKANVSWGVDG